MSNFLQRWLAPKRKPVINFGTLFDGATISDNRPFMMSQNSDFIELVNEWDLSRLRSASRKLFANLGPARAPVIQRATYAFGRAWKPIFTGTDKEWGKAATELLVEETLKICDVRGENFDFVTGLFLDSITIDRDGDIAIVFTESEDGYPAFLRVMGHRIGSRNDMDIVRRGPYRGLKIRHGVIMNGHGRPVAYRIMGEDEEDDVDISARDLAFVYDPDVPDQIRGFPILTHAINDLLDLMVTQGFEKQASMIASAIGLVEYNDSGTAEDFASMVSSADGGAGPPISVQTFFGGLVKYFRANGGGKIESLKTDRPGTNWETFMNRLIRNSCAGVPWPYELAYDPTQLAGTNARLILSQAQKAIEDRQALSRPVAKRMIGYCVAKLINIGRLASSEDWWRWDFSLPARLVIDYGRDKRADREDWQSGVTNLTDILAEQGKSLEEHYRERAFEIALRQQVAEEVEEETGYPIDDSQMGIPTLPKAAPASGAAPGSAPGAAPGSAAPVERPR